MKMGMALHEVWESITRTRACVCVRLNLCNGSEVCTIYIVSIVQLCSEKYLYTIEMEFVIHKPYNGYTKQVLSSACYCHDYK